MYPRRCAICGEIVSPKGQYACEQCIPKAIVIGEPRCKCCGKSIENMEQEYCFDCARKSYYFEYGFSLWNYDETMRRSISDFKYHHRREYADFYGEQFVQQYGEQILALEIDALVPVPVHWTKYIQRGYNQAQVIAQVIGERLGIDVVDDLLVRTRKTVAQKQLNDQERAKNLEKAFAISEKWENTTKKLNNVLIIDDIYTTGSTVNMCAKTLKETGILKVYFAVLCIGKGF